MDKPKPVADKKTLVAEQLHVRPWDDPILKNLGIDARSPYVEQYWLSILGPSTLLLLRRLCTGLEHQPEGYSLVSAELSAAMGLGSKGGINSPFWRSVSRLCRFRMAHRSGEILQVHQKIPPLTRTQAERLPSHLQRAHENWTLHHRPGRVGPQPVPTPPNVAIKENSDSHPKAA